VSLQVAGRGEPTALVRSAANPEPAVLLVFRAMLQRRSDLRDLFTQFRAESRPVEWLRDMLTPRAAVALEECSFEEVREVCQYLADEYQQLACVPGCQLDDGWFVVDETTGRVLTVASPEDVYDPGLLARESGGLAPALQRLNPAVEARLITGRHEEAREQGNLAWLAERLPQTDLVRDLGDRRLRMASRAGRTDIARQLSETDPATLLWRAGGRAALFLRHLARTNEGGATGMTQVEGVASARLVIGLQDQRAVNLLTYDPLSALRGVAGLNWARAVARQLSYVAKETSKAALPISAEDVTDDLFASAETWVIEPDVYVLLGSQAQAKTFIVEGAETIGMTGNVGWLAVGSDLGVQTRELSDRWEVTATISYTVHVDLKKIQVLPLVGIARAAEHA
jgi:hypothetical protein